MQGHSNPVLFNISGPYAVGKDTILNAILNRHEERIHRVRTVTTRPVSPTADPHYEQVSPEEFEVRISKGRWIANYQLSGRTAYATSIDEIENAARAGFACIHSVYAGASGAGKLREIFGTRAISLGLLATPGGIDAQLKVLRGRLLGRNRDDQTAIEARLKHQVEPLEYVLQNPVIQTGDGPLHVFDHVLVNVDLKETVRRSVQIFETTVLGGSDD